MFQAKTAGTLVNSKTKELYKQLCADFKDSKESPGIAYGYPS